MGFFFFLRRHMRANVFFSRRIYIFFYRHDTPFFFVFTRRKCYTRRMQSSHRHIAVARHELAGAIMRARCMRDAHNRNVKVRGTGGVECVRARYIILRYGGGAGGGESSLPVAFQPFFFLHRCSNIII